MERTEVELVRAIRKVLSGDAPGVVVPVGDDAAVVEPGRHQGLLSIDLLVEGVHFELGATSAHDLGHKAITVNVSDVAAMGGSPRYAIAGLIVPDAVEAAWVMELYGGMREGADDYGMALVGGDTSGGDQAVIAVTVYGEVPKGKAVTRAGAHPGDVLVVTGSLGGSAAGLRVARAEAEEQRELLSTEAGRTLLGVHERPVARLGEGQALARAGATSMIDLSDGLSLDVARVCEESGVGARIRVSDVPVHPALEELSARLRASGVELAMHGGEDYELLATLPPKNLEEATAAITERYGTGLTAVGEITEGTGVVAVEPDGSERMLDPRGWDHFGR